MKGAPVNPYERRQEGRRQRLLARAERLSAEAAARSAAAQRALDVIPLGQPILVGHHSEKRHRRDLARVDTNLRRAHEASTEALDLRQRAASVGTGGISSDDPEAVSKLLEKLARLEARQARMKAVNDAHRRFFARIPRRLTGLR